MFSIGDTIFWSSQANASHKVKRGTIVLVVPAGETPYTIMPIAYKALYDRSPLDGGGMARKEQSYLVAVPQSGKAKPKLYWPRVSALKKAES
jgi:hypothetical protein